MSTVLIEEADLEKIAAFDGPKSPAVEALARLRQGLADGLKMICVGNAGQLYVLNVRELLRSGGPTKD